MSLRRALAGMAFVMLAAVTGACSSSPQSSQKSSDPSAADASSTDSQESFTPQTPVSPPPAPGDPKTDKTLQAGGDSDPGWKQIGGEEFSPTMFIDTVGRDYAVLRDKVDEEPRSDRKVKVVKVSDNSTVASYAVPDADHQLTKALFVGKYIVLVQVPVGDETKAVDLVRIDPSNGKVDTVKPKSGIQPANLGVAAEFQGHLAVLATKAGDANSQCIIQVDEASGADSSLYCVPGGSSILELHSTPDALSWMEISGEAQATSTGCRKEMVLAAGKQPEEIAKDAGACRKSDGLRIKGWDVYSLTADPAQESTNPLLAVLYATDGKQTVKLGTVEPGSAEYCGSHLYWRDGGAYRRWGVGDDKFDTVQKQTKSETAEVSPDLHIARCAAGVLTGGYQELAVSGTSVDKIMHLDQP